MTRFLSVAWFLVAVALVGAGCRSSSTPSNSSTPAARIPVAYLPPETPPESEAQQNLRELREALMAFQQLKTFRAKLKVVGKEGSTTGQIDVMKPDRFHGVVQVAGISQSSEVIGVAKTLYAKLPNGTWAALETPEVARALTEAFRSALDGNTSVLEASLPDGTRVTKMEGGASSCDRYQTHIAAQDGSSTQINICVQNGLPTSITVHSSQGDVSVEYFDFNKLFVIERPTVAKR